MARKNMNNNTTATITVVADTYYEYPINELDAVLRMYGNTDAAIYINRILMPNPEEDDAFFYSSVEAAKDGKVWVEEAHAFMSQSFKATIEGGCADLDDLDGEFEEFGGWNSFVLDNIYQDIFGYTSVTGEDGQAVVYDEDVAKLCEQNGYDVLPCCKDDKEFGDMISYWLIFAQGGEEEFFEREYEVEKYFIHSPETGEVCFEGKFLHSYFDTQENEASFFSMNEEGYSTGYTVKVPLVYGQWRSICLDIENNPENYHIEFYAFSPEEGFLFHTLEEMPCDLHGVHATGDEYLEVNGDWVYEYEDDEDDILKLVKFGFKVTLDEEPHKITDEEAYFLISQGRNMVLDVLTDVWEDLTDICEGFFPEPEEPDFTDKNMRRKFRRDMSEKDKTSKKGKHHASLQKRGDRRLRRRSAKVTDAEIRQAFSFVEGLVE